MFFLCHGLNCALGSAAFGLGPRLPSYTLHGISSQKLARGERLWHWSVWGNHFEGCAGPWQDALVDGCTDGMDGCPSEMGAVVGWASWWDGCLGGMGVLAGWVPWWDGYPAGMGALLGQTSRRDGCVDAMGIFAGWMS